MKINIECLIGVVQESFDNDQSYRFECRKKDYWKRTQAEKDSIAWHERNAHNSNSQVYDLCTILGIDMSRLYTIARIARKWEQKHNWEKCFPTDTMHDKILAYLMADNEWSWWDKNWVNTNINRRAEKAAKKVA